MSDDLRRIYNHCDPYKPAADEFYLDCSAARGGGMLSQEFIRRLQLADDHLSFLFAGHIGCGKSSELAELCRRLEQPPYGQPRYFPVLIDTNEYLDYYDADTTDIILAIVTELAAALRDRLGIELYDNYFVRRINEVKKFFLSEVEIAEGELPLWAAKLKVSRLKRDPDARQQVRAALVPKMSSMLQEINVVFEQARNELRKKLLSSDASTRPDFVIILDNLEKIRRFGGREEGLDSQRELFVERYSQLAGLAAHCIYTLPLRLVRSTDGPQLAQRYDGDPFVLPMIKVCERATRGPFQLGLDQLRELLRKRVSPCSIEDVFDSDALDFLLAYSGGQTRGLLTFVQSACAYSQQLPIGLQAVQRAAQQAVRTYSTSIPHHHWQKLAELDVSEYRFIPGGDPDFLAMLENLSVLEYINGGDGDPFAAAEPWYAVNPIVRELGQFKAARSGLCKVKSP
jgi:hypothetical protein